MTHDVVVIGAGQEGLSVAYWLRRTPRTFRILDAEQASGGAWRPPGVRFGCSRPRPGV